MSQASKYAIETISLSKAFKDWWGRTKVLAVDELDLQIKHNEVYGLLGPNGSGKSTTIKMILSLLKPTKGKAFVLGGESSNPEIAAKVGFLPEESYLYKYLSAKETLKFYGNLFGLPSRVLDIRIDELLDMVGLSGMANRPIGTFSKGMARRIGLAQALINDPELLILDEPTSGLDPIGTRQIKDLIISLAKRGKTILMCSHLLADVEDVCDRIGILYGGKMQKEGYVSDMLQVSDKQQFITSTLPQSAVEKIKKIVDSEKASLEVTSPRDRLEDLFVRIVDDAQKTKQVTSGAVSTTKIGEFLSGGAETDILENLVSAEISEEIEPAKEEAATEMVEVPVEENQELLKTLSSEVEEKVEAPEVEKAQKKPVKSDEKVNKDLLEQLIKGPATPEKTDEEKAGDDENA